MFLAVEDVCLGYFEQPAIGKRHFDDVLDVLDSGDTLDEFPVEDGDDVIGHLRVDVRFDRSAGGGARSPNSFFNSVAVEVCGGPDALWRKKGPTWHPGRYRDVATSSSFNHRFCSVTNSKRRA